MTNYDTPERLDAAADKLLDRLFLENLADYAASALNGKPLVIESDVTAELGRHAVKAEWETPMDEHGERGVIEELHVREGRYAVDVTELVKSGWLITDHEDTDTTWVERFDSTAARHEIKVRCEYVMSFKHGERFLALYDVSEGI